MKFSWGICQRRQATQVPAGHPGLAARAADDDRFIPPVVARRVADRYGAPLQSMLGHGHMLVLEPGWEAVADAVARWCAST